MTKFKRFSRFILGAIFLVALAGTNSFAQTLDQHHSVDSLKVGDLFNFSLILKKDQSYDQIIYPDSSSFTGDFELRERKKFRVADFKDSLYYRLQFWGTDTDTIPPLPVKLVANGDTTTIYTQPVIIRFKTVLQADKDKEKMRPLKPIFNFAAAWWPYIIGLIVLLLAAALIYYLYQRYRAQPEPEAAPEFKPQPFTNPLKELENNLRQLQNISLTSKEQFEQYYISLGNAIRIYFDQMYRIPALESTSREIIYELNRRAIDDKLIEQTRIVLREADLVKFANFAPTQEQAEKTFAKAEEFLSIAKKLHGRRIEQMRRQHLARIEQSRREFNEQQNKEKA